MPDKLSAHFENREYFFVLLGKRPADRTAAAAEEVQIDMYGTLYVFIKRDGKWVNKSGNKMNMIGGLIEAVIAALDLAGH